MRRESLGKSAWRAAAIQIVALCLFSSVFCGCAAWRPPPPPPPLAQPATNPPPQPTVTVIESLPASNNIASAKAFLPSPDKALALQVGLDRLNFSPGCLDGRWGSQTRVALEAWRKSVSDPASGMATDDEWQRLVPSQPLTNYTVTLDDHAELTDVPTSWRERAKLPRLGYETILEMVAERFHASEVCIRQLNPNVTWPDPPDGTLLVVPNPTPASFPKAASLEVNLTRKFVRAYDERGRLVAHFPCSIARLKEKRPQGETTVTSVVENPVYTFDPALFSDDPEARDIASKLIIQAGPNNPVGVAWVGMDLPGYGIHGTPWPEDIGRTESHGCIRLANWNAAKLIRMVRPGIPVRFAAADQTAP